MLLRLEEAALHEMGIGHHIRDRVHRCHRDVDRFEQRHPLGARAGREQPGEKCVDLRDVRGPPAV